MILRYALFISIAFSTLSALAQPTLTEANAVPAAGQIFAVNTANTFLDAGGAGANQTYDYWNLLLPSTGTQDFSYLAPSVTPTSAAIPSAELLSTDGGTDTLFWATTANGLEQVGIRAALEGTVSFSDPSLELKLPCTFGTTWSDPTGASYTVSGFPVARVGTITGSADAYGTLQMPWAVVYPAVLRVRVRRNIVDNSALGVVTRISNINSYYSTTQPHPIVKLIEDSTQFGTGAWAISRRALWTGNPVIVGTSDLTPDQFVFSAFPNPTSGIVTLSLDASAPTNCIAELTSATGQVVMTQRLSDNQGSMDVRALAPGVYQLRLFSANNLLGTQRLVVR